MLHILKKKFITLKEELSSYTPAQRAFIFFAMLSGFFICCEYSIIRPVANSLFIQHFSAKYFPYAWLALLPLNFLMVSIYNRLIPKWGSKKLFFALILTVMGANGLFALFSRNIPALSFAFYMWKEIYVLLMFQLLWSVIHSNINLKRAKYLYGIFFGVGGLGSILGSSFPGFFAIAYGSENLIFLTLPVYLCLSFVYFKMSHYCTGEKPADKPQERGGFLHGLQLIRGSRFLIFILLIVCFMQMSSAIVDFQFNDFLGRAYPLKDARTEQIGRIMGIINTITVILQFAGTYFLIQWMGLKRSHYSVPMILSLPMTVFVAAPVLPIISLAFIAFKAFDFSIFGAIKEMLYVPLKPDEKYRAKAIIDVFAYRSSKAVASLLILLVQFTIGGATQILTFVNIAILLLWILSVGYGLKEYEKITGSA